MILSALNRKLARDLWLMRGQALAICLVIACGAATFVLSLSTLRSLIFAHESYYEHNRFADVFAHVKRAPNSLASRIAEIPGVAQVQTHVVAEVNLDIEGMAEPAIGRLISVPDSQPVALNELYLRSGRLIEPGRADEVLVSEAFALAHKLGEGDTVTAIINGRRQALRIVGVALSPEYVYQIRPGDILPDDKRFGVFWMAYSQLAPAFDMDGAFNDIALSLAPGASVPEVIKHLDDFTERYGSLGAFGRDDHPSHKFISNEIRELSGMAIIVPTIFLSVAVFLLNVVVSRLVGTQREQIAALKAFGYFDGEIGWHFLKLVLSIVVIGVAIGSTAGAWLASNLTQMYTKFFHFPVFKYHLETWVVLSALGVCMAAGLAGTLGAVRRAMKLPPAQAMRPEPPAVYRPTVIERIGLQRLFSPAARMIVRQLERRPIKSMFTGAGIAMAIAVLVLGSFMKDAIEYVMDLNFQIAQRQDITVMFNDARSGRALAAIEHLPGVLRAEPFRSLGVRLRSGQYSRRVGLLGLPIDSDLFRLVDLNVKTVPVALEGLVMSAKLAELLHVKIGDRVTVEVLEESRPVREVPIAGLLDDFAGTSAYMSLPAMNRLMRQDNCISGAYVSVDQRRIDELYHELKTTPQVAGVSIKQAALQSFRDTVAENLMRMRAFNVGFACIIAFGVVYNSVRISLSERSRELATLRVIGFTRAEVSAILLSELALLTLLAIPIGLVLGYGFSYMTSMAYNNELFRIPLVIERSTYAFAVSIVLVAALASGLAVRRQIDHLDLVAVLKTKE